MQMERSGTEHYGRFEFEEVKEPLGGAPDTAPPPFGTDEKQSPIGDEQLEEFRAQVAMTTDRRNELESQLTIGAYRFYAND